ncbi:MAG TPA: hypothetical protein VND80_08715 [Steroidobacteraceae bacterium]|nr:hypothetical protein [Steroidobacteraceae bacterium]
MNEHTISSNKGTDQHSLGITAGRAVSWLTAFLAVIALGLSAYSNYFRATHVSAIFAVLLGMHMLRYSRIFWCREFSLYAGFFGYMMLALLWTRDTALAANTLVPAFGCLIVMILLGSLVRFHDLPSIFAGAFYGFVAAAAFYTLTRGFPLSYPRKFSYNAIAEMYLFGLFVVILYGGCKQRGGFLVFISIVVLLHIVATTSIKTNLGILLGGFATTVMYFRYFGRVLRRGALALTILGLALTFMVASNQTARESIDRGFQRVQLGVDVLEARGNVPGYSAFNERDYWEKMGFRGWAFNPIFGHGTEAFRADYGITSHSTPIDLLYNSGVIGLSLFYGIFVSLVWRIFRIENRMPASQRSLIFGGIVCYVFVTLSGTMHYSLLLAAFVAISAALLRRYNDLAASQGVGVNRDDGA